MNLKKIFRRRKPLTFKNLPPEIQLLIWSFAALDTPYNPEHDASMIPGAGITRWWNNETRRLEYRQYHNLQCGTVVRYSETTGEWVPMADKIRSTTRRSMHPLLHACYDSRRAVAEAYNLELAFGTLVNFSRDVFMLDFITLACENHLVPRDCKLYDMILDLPSCTSRIENLAVGRTGYFGDELRWWSVLAPPIKQHFAAVKHICMATEWSYCHGPATPAWLSSLAPRSTAPCPPGFGNYSVYQQRRFVNWGAAWDAVLTATQPAVSNVPGPVFTGATEIECRCRGKHIAAAGVRTKGATTQRHLDEESGRQKRRWPWCRTVERLTRFVIGRP